MRDGIETRRVAAQLGEAMEDLIDAAFVNVEGGDGHDGGAEESGEGEVERC